SANSASNTASRPKAICNTQWPEQSCWSSQCDRTPWQSCLERSEGLTGHSWQSVSRQEFHLHGCAPDLADRCGGRGLCRARYVAPATALLPCHFREDFPRATADSSKIFSGMSEPC